MSWPDTIRRWRSRRTFLTSVFMAPPGANTRAVIARVAWRNGHAGLKSRQNRSKLFTFILITTRPGMRHRTLGLFVIWFWVAREREFLTRNSFKAAPDRISCWRK